MSTTVEISVTRKSVDRDGKPRTDTARLRASLNPGELAVIAREGFISLTLDKKAPARELA